jgi:predicted deacylase
MAHAFGAPVMLDAEIIEGSLRQVAHVRKIPFLVYEGGEALRYDETAIRIGLQGILAVMRHLKMLPAIKTKAPKAYQARSSHWARAPHSGILRPQRKLGSHVKAGDLLGVISNPFGSDLVEVHAKEEGIIIGQICIPLVNRGDALFHIASFAKASAGLETIERIEDRFDTQEKLGS